MLLTGTVTLLVAGIQGAAGRPIPTDSGTPEFMLLDRLLSEAAATHGGVRVQPDGHFDGESFVIAFGGAGAALACALQLQLTRLDPIRLPIGLHTGDVRLSDDATSYVGTTITRASRLCALAHGGQTLLSATTADVVADQLPAKTWLSDCGAHQLRDLARPEQVHQLCHPELQNEFPPLCTTHGGVAAALPVHLTNFVGRRREIAEVTEILRDNRLVTLIGGGGIGKSRLAVRVATQLRPVFPDGLYYVDLEPVTSADFAPAAVTRALGVADKPGRSVDEAVLRHLGQRRVLIVLDNCEHLLDSAARRIGALLRSCPGVTMLATSREPLAVAGEVTWRVPALCYEDDAIAFFVDRARSARPNFGIADDNANLVSEICRRLDGMPLGIELAAARVRSLSLPEIRAGLDDKIRLLTGGARTGLRRHQTLRASIAWSHELLSESEQVLFRRLGVFVGPFGLDAAHAVVGFGDMPRYQVLDGLSSLVDKSLVAADSSPGGTRYRRFEGIGEFAMERLAEAGEVETTRRRHATHYLAMAAVLDSPGRNDYLQLLDGIETEIDNLRAALAWYRDNSGFESALMMASSLQQLWLVRGHISEGRDWFESLVAQAESDGVEIDAAVWARALADKAVLKMFIDATPSIEDAQQALKLARDVGDPALTARALTACGLTAGFNYQTQTVQHYFAEAAQLARALGDRWRLSQILSWQSSAAIVAGDANAAHALGREGRDLCDLIGDRIGSRQCRLAVAYAQLWRGDLAGAVAQFGALVEDGPDADVFTSLGLKGLGDALAYQGDVSAARAASAAAIESATGEYFVGLGYSTLALTALADGDVGTAREADEKVWQNFNVQPQSANFWRAFKAQVQLASGDTAGARQSVEEGVESASGWHRSLALTTRCRIAIAQKEPGQARRDAYDALSCAAEVGAHGGVPDVLECLACLAVDDGNYREAARLFGAAEAHRVRTGSVRLKVYDGNYDASVNVLRSAMSDNEMAAAWAEGAALSTADAITHAQRNRVERRRATSGWPSLTRAELDVVRLVGEGLSNRDIAERLFVSPRTVQTHLTHVYTKLGFNSRVQLAQEAVRRA
ncbi:LuxR C-terminal-related transcriptional regulator [Mycobacterium sp. TY814]|uniref:helix-turn-helix transcriptional regulator n=1 Tax=unclassified Mycobacterium TaxID=2642494 RepID=UPI0027415C12|nr:LuxR C-terminal-related transcriptional regulator [Mycobacterium sp. TY814]MDP7722131.1 LuxR C-terminal-related transcriptional regulator [Mycobacterium sp. TY814]